MPGRRAARPPVPNGAAARAAVLAALLGCAPRYEYRPPPCPPEPPPPALRSDSDAPSAPGLLAGRVEDGTDGRPVAGARVMLLPPAPAIGALTDSAGRFQLEGLAPGRYEMEVWRIGYVPRRETVALPRGSGSGVVVPLVAAPSDGCPGFAVMRVKKPWWKLW